MGQVKKLTNIGSPIPIPVCSNYNLIGILRDRCESVIEIGYDKVPNEYVVQKALKLKKPFSDGEKGFRDALIWLSFLMHVKDHSVEGDVAFITNNKNDFFANGADGLQLHPDLIDDINFFGVSVKIRPYETLFKFIQDFVDKSDHAIDRNKTRYDADEFLEENAVKYIESVHPSQYRQEIIKAGLPSIIANEIVSVEADIMEGVEDCDLLDYEVLGKDEVFLAFAFDLRILVLKFHFSTTVYLANKQIFDAELINFENEGDSTSAELCIRAYFHISCIYSPRTEDYERFTVAGLRFRI
ncbi:PIN domain-containing protein [Massilia aurea]|uniref:PIN domain-containing protein n=1 Tax=Massilia aurea TaxID=373040 RepID=UPI003461AEAE